jgi:hypothetical protein
MNNKESLLVNKVKLELERTENERLSAIGRAARPSGFGISEGGDEHTDIEVGKTVLERIIQEFRVMGCNNETVRKLAESGENSSTITILIIIDIVTTFLSGPAVFSATASVLKYGVKNICVEEWISNK